MRSRVQLVRVMRYPMIRRIGFFWYTKLMCMTGNRGFTLVELIIVSSVIAILAAVGIIAFGPFSEKRNDDQRSLEMHRFAQKLEEFRNQKGAYVCGDDCIKMPSNDYYTIDCSNVGAYIHGNETNGTEVNGFLNGGDCCNLSDPSFASANLGTTNHQVGGFPAPTSTADDLSWGLFKWGYLTTPASHDPVEANRNSKMYTYCYGSPINGRKSFALFARLERSDADVTDGGITDEWYEILSDGYPRNGWWPGYTPSAVCGDGSIIAPEECDDGNTVSNDGCNSLCHREYCGDGIEQVGLNETCDPPGELQPPYNRTCRVSCTYCGDSTMQPSDGEQCDDGNNNNGDSCKNTCIPPLMLCDYDGICEPPVETEINCPDDCLTATPP